VTEKKKILIADDDNFVHRLFGDHFEKEFEVLHAYDGAETLMVSVEQRPDVVLLDIMMPLVDGRTVCRKIKEHPSTKGVKVVMVTGKREQHDRLVGFEVGADEYIEKPVSLEYLQRIVNNLLR